LCQLVLGKKLTDCKKPSSHKSASTLPNRSLSNACSPRNFISLQSPLPTNGTAPDEVVWVVVHAKTDIKYNKNLAQLMEHICNKITKFLTETIIMLNKYIYYGMIDPIKLAKKVYSQADPQTGTTCTMTAADNKYDGHTSYVHTDEIFLEEQHLRYQY